MSQNDDLISRQAVTKFLNDWLSCLFENCHKQSASDLKMIIKDFKNLPSVQPKPCEDAVSREAVLSMIDTYMNKSVELHYLPTSDGIKKLISILPSAQPETAKRIVGKSRGGMTLWYQCDMCNEPVDTQDDYCRRCGRRLIDETD